MDFLKDLWLLIWGCDHRNLTPFSARYTCSEEGTVQSLQICRDCGWHGVVEVNVPEVVELRKFKETVVGATKTLTGEVTE